MTQGESNKILGPCLSCGRVASHGHGYCVWCHADEERDIQQLGGGRTGRRGRDRWSERLRDGFRIMSGDAELE